jgi:transcriptional regulator with XRE-family HTH domain
MTDYDDLVARNVKRLRGERNLSMAALAAQAGLSKQTLSKIEQGQGNPTLGTLEAISMALGTTARALITEWGSSIRVQSALSAQWVPGHDGETRMLEQLYGSGYVRTAIVKLNPALQGPASAALSSGSIHQVFLIDCWRLCQVSGGRRARVQGNQWNSRDAPRDLVSSSSATRCIQRRMRLVPSNRTCVLYTCVLLPL